MTPQIQILLRFLYDAPTAKFHHLVFTRSEVIVLTNTPTNKQTNPHTSKQILVKTSNVFHYAMASTMISGIKCYTGKYGSKQSELIWNTD